MVDQGGGSKATERTLSVLPLEKRAALATVLVAIAFACQQTVSGGLYAFNRYALSFGCGESPAMFPSGTVRTLEEYSPDGPIFNSIAAGGYLELHRGCFVQAAVAPDAIPSGSAAPAARALADALLPGAHE